MTKTELEQALKEANAKNIELKNQIKELSKVPSCDEQLKPLNIQITELKSSNDSLKIRLEDAKEQLEDAQEIIKRNDLDKVERDLSPAGDVEQDLFGQDYSDEQIDNMPTDFVVIDGMTGLTRLPDGSVINSQFMAVDVSDTGARRLILVGKVDGKVTVEADIKDMEIRQSTTAGKTVYKLQAV